MRWYWIDRFTEFVSGSRAKAVKNVSLAEEHLHDHYSPFPVMPKSLIIEGLAQTGGLLVCEHSGFKEKVVLAKVPKITFYSEACPGDTLVYTAVADYIHDYGAMVTVTSHKNGELHAEGDLAFAHLAGAHHETQLFADGDLLQMMRILRAYEVGRTADGEPIKDPESE